MNVQYWAEIIKEAARSQLGIFALMILAIASIAVLFFREGSEIVRLIVFLAMLVGVALFGYAVSQTAPVAAPEAAPPPTVGAAHGSPPTDLANPPPGERRRNARDGLDYAWIPSGAFVRGCTEEDPDDCFPGVELPKSVTISESFWIGATEVTVGAYRRHAGDALPEPPPYDPGWQKSRHPIANVTWDGAEHYCAWAGGHLPTEAQWEYAARGGLDGKRYPSGDDLGPGEAHLGESPSEVGKLAANGLGLHDTAGNVSEWVRDWWAEGYDGVVTDPRGPASGSERVVRGGSFEDAKDRQRVYLRWHAHPDAASDAIGFRCALPQTFAEWTAHH